MKRVLVAALVTILLMGCGYFVNILAFGPYEICYLYDGCDTLDVDRVRQWGGVLRIEVWDIDRQAFIQVSTINNDGVLSWRPLDPTGHPIERH